MISTTSRLTYAAVLLRKQLAGRDRPALASAAAFLVFILAAFFVKGSHALAVGPVILGALLAFRSGTAAETFRRNAWFWAFLGFLGVWMGLGTVFGGQGYRASDFLNLALLGAFFLFVAQVSLVLSARQILWIVAVAGGASALASILLHLVTANHILDRMIPLGRGGNPIPGAGGLAISLISLAAIGLKQRFERRVVPAALALAATLAVALVWTQSRAPIIALGLALPLALWLNGRGTVAVLAACGAAWIVVAGLIFFEPAITRMICGSGADWCRPSHRVEIWGWVSNQIGLHPMFGSGPSFRFSNERWMSHPHNGLLGIAMYFGLAALAGFVLMIAAYARNLAHRPDETLRFFGVASLIFSFGYMGADLSNPFAFFNMHYLFLWLPLFLVLSSGLAPVHEGANSAAPLPEALRRI